jgi:hypothetical protein
MVPVALTQYLTWVLVMSARDLSWALGRRTTALRPV